MFLKAIQWGILATSITFSNVMADTVRGKFVTDYFSSRTVHQIVVFGCWDPSKAMDFSRSLMKMKTSVCYVSISGGLDMSKILKVNYYRLGIYVDLDCAKSEVIFQQFTDQRMRYNETYWWLIETKKKSVPHESFSLLPLTIATEMTVALRGDDEKSYEFYDVYNPSYVHGAKLNVTFMGAWSTLKGLNITLTQYKYQRRGNLFGLALNSSVALDYAPKPDLLTYLGTPINPGHDTMHRFNYGLIVQLMNLFNFTIDLKRGTTWGYLLPNGSYTGILGDMSMGLVDISVTPFQYKKDRVDVVEYTVPAWVAKVCLIFRHPQKNELTNAFLKPFESDVWGWIIFAGVINWISLFLTVKVEQYYDSRDPVNTLDTNPASEVGLIAVAAICQQGLSDGPRSFSGRIVFIFLFLWALLMFQFYSASVVGSLLVEKPRYITTPQDVLDSSLAVGSEDIAYNYDFFATTDDPAVKGIFEKKMAVDKKLNKRPFFTVEEGLSMMKKGGFAFQVDTATAYKIIEETFTENEICELQEIHLFPPRPVSTGVAKHSPFKKIITYGLRKISEHGTIERLRKIWKHRRPECPESHSSMPVPVIIEEFSPALLLLIFGCGFSLFVMLVEHLALRWEAQKSMDKNDDPLNQTTSNLDGGKSAVSPVEISYPNELAY